MLDALTLDDVRELGYEAVPTCQYCGELLTWNEFDNEPGSQGFFSSHYRCSRPAADGQYAVTSLFKGSGSGSHTVRFTTLKRARAEADHLASFNRGDWAFRVSSEGVSELYWGRRR